MCEAHATFPLPFARNPFTVRPAVKLRAALALSFLLFFGGASAADVGIGDSREAILNQYGKPSSIARRGDHEIFLYPKGGRIEFVNGKVVDVKGPLPSPIAPPAASVEPATAPPPEKTPAAGGAAAAPQPAPVPPPKTEDDYNPAVAANELAKHVEKMDTPWGAAPPLHEATHSPLDALPSFLTGLVLRFAFTVIALKLAFKYWEMDAFWKGIFMIAGIDMAVHAVFELLGPVTGGFSTMPAVENGIAGLVLIYTVHRFCFNKRIQNAVLTAAAVKLVVSLCYIFAGVATLNMIYG
jgi:hypothetical protein